LRIRAASKKTRQDDIDLASLRVWAAHVDPPSGYAWQRPSFLVDGNVHMLAPWQQIVGFVHAFLP
jgi:hypothetical protein